MGDNKIYYLNNEQPISFKSLYEELQPEICFFAERLTSNKLEAQDISAEGFAKLWKSEQEFINKEHLRRFLYTTVKNDCISYLRKQKAIDNYNTHLNQQLLFSEKNIEQLICEAELIKQLYAEIEKLPAQCKKVFELTHLEGLSRVEVAKLLNLSPNTVKEQNARAMKFLRLVFNEKELIVLLIILSYQTFKN